MDFRFRSIKGFSVTRHRNMEESVGIRRNGSNCLRMGRQGIVT